jgi:type VI secretion system secreted protein VgrG
MIELHSISPDLTIFRFSVLGCAEDLRVVRFASNEGMSTLYELHLELACENQAIEYSDVVGKSALFSMSGTLEPYLVHGIVSRFEQINEMPKYALYRAHVVPKVWRLRHRYNNRIFQQKTTPDIIKKVLDTATIPSDYYRFSLSGSYEPRDYCVQYRESDWAFVSRLMEEDGIFYYFEHEDDKHVMVIGDSRSACQPISGPEVVPFRRPGGEVVNADHVQRIRFAEEIQPGQVSLRDFNFKKPSLPMQAQQSAQKDPDLEVYDYPGEYQDPGRGSPAKGTDITQIRLEEWQATREVGHGESNCERLSPGHFFTLAEHTRGSWNARYLITGVWHQGYQPQVMKEEALHGEFSYSNQFACIPADTPYRPTRVTPKPVVRGIQTATVVGPSGEEIHTDEFGRIKVQFHWDREGQKDDKSSCWIRVSQPWAGEAWGGIAIPRIGQEVIIDFIEGDPDRPIITGRVYNGLNPTPYQLPDEKTKTTIKSNTSPGGGGFNELRFEDRKGSEQVFIRSQRNMDVYVKHDYMETVLHDYHQTIGEEGDNGKVGDRSEMVYRDMSLKVHRHSTELIGGDKKLLVGGIDGGQGNVHILYKGNLKKRVDKEVHMHVVGHRNDKVDQTWSITVGKNMQEKVAEKHALEAGKEIHLKSQKVVVEAATGLTVKGPGGFITIDASGIAISGTMVKINSGGSALSGAGSSPTAPADPAEAAPPTPVLSDKGLE